MTRVCKPVRAVAWLARAVAMYVAVAVTAGPAAQAGLRTTAAAARTPPAGGWAYQDARRELQRVLAAPAFHSPVPAQPWWLTAWRWVRRHLWHAPVSGHLRPPLWAVCAAVALAAAAVALWWRAGRANRARVRRVEPRTAAYRLSEALVSANRALQAGDDRSLLAHLLEAALLWASDRGWVRAAKHKTARRYRLELACRSGPNGPDPAFVALFGDLVEAAEAVRFAGSRLDRERAERLWQRVLQRTEESGA